MHRRSAIVNRLPLGAPGELWRVVPNNPGNEWVVEQSKAMGRDVDIAYWTSRSLLDDVLQAAGAIEYTVQRIDVVAASVQAYADKHDVKSRLDEVPMGLITAEVAEAYIEYANLLNWLRTLGDRMRSTDPYSKAKLGLIPALNPEMPLRRDVEMVFDRFERHPLIVDEPLLTNFGLHLHALPGGGSPKATITPEGRARLLIPDKPRARVYLFDQFTYTDERELVQFAHDVVKRVEIFVDELLTAFETGTAYALGQRAQESTSV
jgi:hypothetical protein